MKPSRVLHLTVFCLGLAGVFPQTISAQTRYGWAQYYDPPVLIGYSMCYATTTMGIWTWEGHSHFGWGSDICVGFTGETYLRATFDIGTVAGNPLAQTVRRREQDTLIVATVTKVRTSLVMYDSLHIVSSTPVPANKYDLLSIIVHEAGHILGLPDGSGVMEKDLKPGVSRRILDASDVSAIRDLYGP